MCNATRGEGLSDRQKKDTAPNRGGAPVRCAPSWSAFGAPDAARSEGLDAITSALFPRYAEVAREMAPYRQRVVCEVHPELTFYLLNEDRPLLHPKRFVAGQVERRQLLTRRIPGVERILDSEVPGAKPWHLLDAAACLWTARRVIARAASRLPVDPEWDTQGLRMELMR